MTQKEDIKKLVKILSSFQSLTGYFSDETRLEKISFHILKLIRRAIKTDDHVSLIAQSTSLYYRSRGWYTYQFVTTMHDIVDHSSPILALAQEWLDNNEESTQLESFVRSDIQEIDKQKLLNYHFSEYYRTTIDVELFVCLSYLDKTLSQPQLDNELFVHLFKHVINIIASVRYTDSKTGEIKYGVKDSSNLFWFLLLWGINEGKFNKILTTYSGNFSDNFDEYLSNILHSMKHVDGDESKGYFESEKAPIYDVTPELYNTPFRTTMFCLKDCLLLKKRLTGNRSVKINNVIETLNTFLDWYKDHDNEERGWTRWISNPYLVSLGLQCEIESYFLPMNENELKKEQRNLKNECTIIAYSKRIAFILHANKALKKLNSPKTQLIIPLVILSSLLFTGNLNINLVEDSNIQLILSWGSIIAFIVSLQRQLMKGRE